MRKVRQKPRIVRENPIEKHHTDCMECGHVHEVDSLMRYYKRHGANSIHYMCDKCNHRMRLTITKFGFLVFNQQSDNGYQKKQWEDVFQAAEITIPQDVKTWLVKTYQPPRKRQIITEDGN